jgi:invasion protein IalB
MIRFHLALFLFAVLAIKPAAAQSSADIRIAAEGAWAVDCSAEPQTGEKWCQVGTSLQSNAPPYALQFNYVRDTRMFFAMGSVPLSSVQVRVDGRPAFALDRCLHGMCLLKGAEAAQLLSEMRKGKRLALRFESHQRLPGPLVVDLAAFDAMYRRAVAAPR